MRKFLDLLIWFLIFLSLIIDKIDSFSVFNVISFLFKVMLSRVILFFAFLELLYFVKILFVFISIFIVCVYCFLCIFLFLVNLFGILGKI